MRKIFFICALILTPAVTFAINPDSEIGKSVANSMFNECFTSAVETYGDISLARAWCKCNTDFIIEHVDADSLINLDMMVISELMEQAVPYCQKKLME